MPRFVHVLVFAAAADADVSGVGEGETVAEASWLDAAVVLGAVRVLCVAGRADEAWLDEGALLVTEPAVFEVTEVEGVEVLSDAEGAAVVLSDDEHPVIRTRGSAEMAHARESLMTAS